ncbi:MAG: O-antigen ligase family protein [Flavobacteriales bacterium]|nr:O-antigen ligase family protein [Flavobacteriales bacterium]MCB9196818.1 O-antigen ligase family protein [Flavobacteriales bacterium]
MSIGVIAISANWLLEGDFKNKIKSLNANKKISLIFLLFFLVQIIWLLISPAKEEALKDLKMHLPFLAFPVVIGSTKLKIKELYFVFYAFIAGLIISAGAGYIKYYSEDYENYRELSVFISHIRLGIFIAFGLGLSVYLMVNLKTILRYLIILPIIYLLIFQRLMSSGSGYFATGIVLILVLFYIFKNLRSKLILYSISVIIVALFVFSAFRINSEYKLLTTPNADAYLEMPVYTAQKNLYVHHPEYGILENGYPIYINYCPIEISKTWAFRSEISSDSLDNKGQPIHGTIMRFMTSKGLKKDSVGIMSLTDEEVKLIENGVTSIIPPKNGLSGRIDEILTEYIYFKNGMNPNGHSIVQRLYFLEAGVSIWMDNIFLGIGQGFENQAYLNYYQETNSELDLEHRLHAHNQFITFLVCFGLIGFVLIMIAFITPLTFIKWDFLIILFACLGLIGFVTDDILSRQEGVTFISFFYSLLILTRQVSKRNNIVTNSIN